MQQQPPLPARANPTLPLEIITDIITLSLETALEESASRFGNPIPNTNANLSPDYNLRTPTSSPYLRFLEITLSVSPYYQLVRKLVHLSTRIDAHLVKTVRRHLLVTTTHLSKNRAELKRHWSSGKCSRGPPFQGTALCCKPYAERVEKWRTLMFGLQHVLEVVS